jgi:nucleoside-diphosphate-sugar epimerase
MQLGFVGLGRMGLNMVTRLVQGGHHVVAFDRNPDQTARPGGGRVRRGVARSARAGARATTLRVGHDSGWRRNRVHGDRLGGAPRLGRHDRRRWKHEFS